jgi:uncharacterized protein CbrC (UPF0167 family)
MKFQYFDGALDEMSDLLEGSHECSICGQESEICFEIDYAITDRFSVDEKEGKIGCIDCLKKGEFEFWHDTEFGVLDENGLTKVYNHNMDNPPPIENEKLIELRRTPQIVTLQQELWLTHCNDFMIYKGTWEPIDFNKNSKSGNGKELFLEMTDNELSHLWDDSLEEGGTKLEEWYATYYVFECKHCAKLRGNWDCD